MFYPVKVLSHRLKGNLAPCWLAAMNVKLFRKHYKSVAIKRMNIIDTCKIILLDLPKFGLYLSSQLMYGITKILFYQVIYFENELLVIYKSLEFIVWSKKLEEESQDVRGLESAASIDLSLAAQKLRGLQIDDDLHILPGEIPDGRLQMIMQDAMCLNFGILTDTELDLMHNGDIALELKKMHIMDDNTQENVMEVVEEYREMLSPRMVPSPIAIVDISKIGTKSERELSITPQKRQLQQWRVETPTKKRRLSFGNAMPVDVSVPRESVPMPDTELYAEDTLVPISTDPLPAKEMGVSVSLQHTDIELKPIQTSFDTSTIKKRTKKRVDKRTILEAKAFEQQLRNINIGCKQFVIKPQVHGFQIRSSVIDLFNRPCVRWSTSLLPLFTKRITGRFTSADENIMPIRLTQSEEVVRGLQKTVDECTGQTSNLIEHSKQALAMESSAVKIQDVCIPEDIPYQEIKMDIDNTQDTLEDIENLLQNKRIPSTPERRISESFIRPTRGSHAAHLTSREILAMLEVLWYNKPVIKFSDLVSSETYTREDAATVFCTLLNLHSQKKLVLKQAKFCSTLWIQKYES